MHPGSGTRREVRREGRLPTALLHPVPRPYRSVAPSPSLALPLPPTLRPRVRRPLAASVMHPLPHPCPGCAAPAPAGSRCVPCPPCAPAAPFDPSPAPPVEVCAGLFQVWGCALRPLPVLRFASPALPVEVAWLKFGVLKGALCVPIARLHDIPVPPSPHKPVRMRLQEVAAAV